MVGAAGQLNGAPVEWKANGHFYEPFAVEQGVDWHAANAAAGTLRGYLATITSAPENDFIFGLIDAPEFWIPSAPDNYNYFGPWIGGFQPPDSPEPNGGWQWVTGEPFTYTNWNPYSWPPEPNDLGDEDYIHFFSWSGRDPFWNDKNAYVPVLPVAHVVEWDSNPIPEPPTLSLLATGAILLLSLCRAFGTRGDGRSGLHRG